MHNWGTQHRGAQSPSDPPWLPPSTPPSSQELPADDVFLQRLLLDVWRFLLLPFYCRGLHDRTEQCNKKGRSFTGFEVHKTLGTVTRVTPMPGHGKGLSGTCTKHGISSRSFFTAFLLGAFDISGPFPDSIFRFLGTRENSAH